jgi:phage shock protein PspC (stress-responsive transcriptional regulator)
MSTATAQENETRMQMAAGREPSLPLRGDTLLGVCEAVGQDLGINPNWLRIPFAAALLWNPEVIVACYMGLGLVVAVTRWLFPVRARAAKPALTAAAQAVEPIAADDKSEAKSEELLAA